MAEVVPRIRESWVETFLSAGYLFTEINCDEEDVLPPHLHFSLVLIPILTPKIAKMVRLLRGILKFNFTIIVYAHGAASRSFLEFYDWGLESLLEAKDIIVVSCECDKILGEASFSNATFFVSPFSFKEEKRGEDFNPQNFFFLYHGRINPQKNIRLMIESYELSLIKDHDLPPFYIIGDEDLTFGPIVQVEAKGYLIRLIQYVKEKGLLGKIHFHPYLEPLELRERFLTKSHVFVSYSQHMDENFGFAAFKSLSQGMPAILSGWGGHFELFKLFPHQVNIVQVEKLLAPFEIKSFVTDRYVLPFAHYNQEILKMNKTDKTALARAKWGLDVLALNRLRDHATPFLNKTSVPFRYYFDVYSGKKFVDQF
ncbi:MAG: glycosyltransferase [Bacteriovorax sp.]